MQRGFYVDTERCVGCRSCEVACKQWNALPPYVLGKTGPRWRRVVSIESGTYPAPLLVNVSTACMHCGKPACAAVCPTGAITKRIEDGIVVVNKDKCIGCRYCSFACPFGVPQYGEDGLMQKCNLCLERVERGEDPACVASCPGKALHAGTMEDMSKVASRKAGRKLAGATQPSILISR